jgi:hypothetical protein
VPYSAQIVEIKHTLAGRVDRFTCDLLERTGERIVVLYRLPAPRDLHGVWLGAGTVTVGYFWARRPYNLYHWLSAAGRTLAYYFNVGDVKGEDATSFEWLDLAVDVLATPGGQVRVLDEDELPADLAPETRRYVEAARDEILRDLPHLTAEADRESPAFLNLAGGAP